jgi:hypothetical protein
MLSITQMPADARVWVFQSNTLLSDTEIAAIKKEGLDFINNWTAHGASLKASFDILYNYFIVISVDEKQAMASGCSIDKATHFIKNIEQQLHLTFFDRMQVAYRNGNKIKICHFNNLLDELLKAGTGPLEKVIVFNNMITSKLEFDTKWEVPLAQSWQSRILQSQQK